MSNALVRYSVASALSLICTSAIALPFNSFDPRTMAMGGAGVAVANTATAPFFNPSLLSVTSDEDFAIELPIAGIRAYDPEDFRDSIDEFQDSGLDTQVTDLVTIVNNTPTPTTPAEWTALAQLYRDTATATDNLNAGLQTLDAKPLQVDLGAATVIGVPGKKLGVAFSASAAGSAAGIIYYKDGAQLAGLAADLNTVADYQDCLAANGGSTIICGTTPTLQYVDSSGNIINPDTGQPFDGTTDVKSEIHIRGLLQAEVGLSLSHSFDSLAVGITPKLVKTRVYDYYDNATSSFSDNTSLNDYMKEYSDFNVDIGVAKDYTNGWRTGFVVKNLIAHDYESYRDLNSDGIQDPTGIKFKTKPQARLGISHSGSWHTVALDVDLTENEPVAFEKGSRYIALGTELNLANWAQLRLGYRINTVDSDRNVASAGFGLSPFGVHLDLAVAGNADEIGASAQLGFRF